MFSPRPEDEHLRSEVRAFVEENIIPHAALWDAERSFPRDILQMMGERGYMGVAVPASYGGMGRDHRTYSMICEEVARGCAATATILSVNNSLACYSILKYGSEEQRLAYLPDLAQGRKVGCFAQSEPNAGSDAAAQTTLARRSPSGGYTLSGTKNFVTSGRNAGVIICFATVDPSLRHRGIAAFILEPGDGITFPRSEDKMGIRASDCVQMLLEDVHVPEERLLGKVGMGFRIAMDCLDSGRIGIGSLAVGVAQRCLELSVEHAKVRVQFGQPIGRFQATAYKIADMAMRVSASRLLVRYAASLKDAGRRVTLESSIAKLHASETAMSAAIEAVQIFGCSGVVKGSEVERLFRDAKITQIYEGTSEVQRLVISRELMR